MGPISNFFAILSGYNVKSTWGRCNKLQDKCANIYDQLLTHVEDINFSCGNGKCYGSAVQAEQDLYVKTPCGDTLYDRWKLLANITVPRSECTAMYRNWSATDYNYRTKSKETFTCKDELNKHLQTRNDFLHVCVLVIVAVCTILCFGKVVQSIKEKSNRITKVIKTSLWSIATLFSLSGIEAARQISQNRNNENPPLVNNLVTAVGTYNSLLMGSQAVIAFKNGNKRYSAMLSLASISTIALSYFAYIMPGFYPYEEK